MRILVIFGGRLLCFLGGCPKGNQDYEEAKKALALQDYDTALVHFERAARSDPTNAEYKLYAAQARYDAGQFHVQQGKKALENGDLQLALGEFQKAELIDPSNMAAQQYVKRTVDLMNAQNRAQGAESGNAAGRADPGAAAGIEAAIARPHQRAEDDE